MFHRHRVRQKPAFARAWWRELLADGLASAAGFTLTATSVTSDVSSSRMDAMRSAIEGLESLIVRMNE